MLLETELLKAAAAVGANLDDVMIEEVTPTRLRFWVDKPNSASLFVRLLPAGTPEEEAESARLVRRELPAHS